ncbi:MAG TPA: acyl-CoA thioesterase domain-containing protein, partial [Methylomirabilota bacterium]|nr:acyl-CoA thioesterase domain-containing protein [Methylomirabilota bacterium]
RLRPPSTTLPSVTTDDTSQAPLDHLLEQLDLERLDRDLFLGDPGQGLYRLFGGLVAAQAVVAAYRTVDEGALHSMHAYFLRPGTYDVPIRYVVYRVRDGRTFTTRDVVAYQAGEAIFDVSCSFARPEEGISHQEPPPDLPGPDGLPEWEFVRPDRRQERDLMRRWARESPVEIRSVDVDGPPSGDTPRRRVWMRVRGALPDDPAVHAAMLAYASDRGFIATARMPGMGRAAGWASASLDHAVWFHHTPRFDDWLLYTSESPVAHAARALILGQMYRRDGTRVASVVQEGLIRTPRATPPA